MNAQPRKHRTPFFIFAALALSACSPAPWHTYSVSGQERSLTPSDPAELMKTWEVWHPDPLMKSRADSSARRTLLTTIAAVYRRNILQPPCTKIRLNTVTPMPLADFTYADRTGAQVTHTPSTFNEVWEVGHCGTVMSWRVLDVGNQVVAVRERR